MKRLILIGSVLAFLIAVGMVADVYRSIKGRRALQKEIELLLKEAGQYLPYEPQKAIDYLNSKAKQKNIIFKDQTPVVSQRNCILTVKAAKKLPLYMMRLIGKASTDQTTTKVVTVIPESAGIVGVMDANRIKLAIELNTGIEYKTQFLIRKAGSFKSAPGEDYIQYFFIDKTGVDKFKAGDKIKFSSINQDIKQVINYNQGGVPSVFACVLKKDSNIISGFCEFMVTDIVGDDLIGGFAEHFLYEAVKDNVPAEYYGLFATGEKKITVR
ncbi:MAG: hypothetical protein AB1765_02665 [Candidatus Hydrogenedentota bacterium]